MGKWVCTDQRVAKAVGVPWALRRLNLRFPWRDPVAIMLIDGDRVLAVTAYTDYDEVNVQMHIVSDGSRRWLNRAFLHECFAYPFDRCGVRRVTGLVASSNADALAFDQHLGFRVEGRCRQAAPDGSDYIVLGMLREECRFLKERHEQELRALCA